MFMENIHYDYVERIKSSVDETENQNPSWEYVNEWNKVFVITQQKIKIQSGSRWMDEIKYS